VFERRMEKTFRGLWAGDAARHQKLRDEWCAGNIEAASQSRGRVLIYGIKSPTH